MLPQAQFLYFQVLSRAGASSSWKWWEGHQAQEPCRACKVHGHYRRHWPFMPSWATQGSLLSSWLNFFFSEHMIYVLLIVQDITATSPRLSEDAASCGNTSQPWALPKACTTLRSTLPKSRRPLREIKCHTCYTPVCRKFLTS